MGDLLRLGGSAGTFVVAMIALFISLRLNQRQRDAARLEIARNLHSTLISEGAIEDRHTLGTIHWHNRGIASGGPERGEVLRAYFAMLWRFEYLYLGRKTLLEENGGEHDLALIILDSQTQAHVLEYVCTFYEVKNKLARSTPADMVFDDAYADAFKKLVASLSETADDDTRKRLQFHTRTDVKDCFCACHQVPPKPPLHAP